MSNKTKINSIKFFSEDPNYKDFWNDIELEGQKILEFVIKDKVMLENEFNKRFFERYVKERQHSLSNTNFLFGHNSTESLVLKKECRIIKDFIDNILQYREEAFVQTIVNNEKKTDNFRTALIPYKNEILNVVDNNNDDFMYRYIPNYILEKYYHQYFNTKPITFIGNDAKKQLLIRHCLYNFSPTHNFVTVYSLTENVAYIYLSPEIQIVDFNNIGNTRRLLWKNLKIKDVEFYTMLSQEDFYEFRSYVYEFQESQDLKLSK